MTEEQKAAFVNSQVACALIKAMAMKSANDVAIDTHAYPPYQQYEFENLIMEHSIGYNDVVGFFNS